MLFRKRYRLLSATVTAALLAGFCGGAAAAPAPNNHARYNLFDMGTFGGPASYFPFLNFNSVPTINDYGAVIGASATEFPIDDRSSGFLCGGVDGIVPNIFHAFGWQPGDDVLDLGSLPPTKRHCSVADSINDRGEVLGMSESTKIDPIVGLRSVRSVMWQNGRIINLGALHGGDETLAFGINNREQVVGAATNAVSDPYSLIYLIIAGLSTGTQTRAVLWQDGIMQDLDTLGGPDADAGWINQRGQVAGFSYTSNNPNHSTGVPTLDPFLWDRGHMRDLGTLGGVFGLPNALNDRGEVIGQSSDAANPAACLVGDTPNCHAFLWDTGTLVDLTTTATGGTPLQAIAINNTGEIVGASAFPNAPLDASMWKDGVAVDLGHLGDCGSVANAINSRQQVVGVTLSCASGHWTNAFLWENGTIVDLNSLIPADAHLHLVLASAINDRGEIAGLAVPKGVPPREVNKRGRAFVLIPDERHFATMRISGIAEHRLTAGEVAAMRARAAHLILGMGRHPEP